MKRYGVSIIALFILMTPLASFTASVGLTKKDKQELMDMMKAVAEPVTRMEKGVNLIQEVANTIQSFIAHINIFQESSCKETMQQLKTIEQQLALIIEFLNAYAEVVGLPNDQSVGDEQFNSVADIDKVELTFTQWFKTIYRELLKDKFIS